MAETTLSFTTSNGTTAQAVSSAKWASTVVVTNDTALVAYVTTDGTVATSGSEPVQPGQTEVFGNSGPLINANTKPNQDQSESEGWTPQQEGQGTSVSVVLAANPSVTSSVTVELQ